MFVALVLFAALGDPVVRLLKPMLTKLQVPGRGECRADSAGPERRRYEGSGTRNRLARILIGIRVAPFAFALVSTNRPGQGFWTDFFVALGFVGLALKRGKSCTRYWR
jgi:hypothetical protein